MTLDTPTVTTKLDLLKDALVIAPENYKDNVRIISGLDDKAQKMGAIAGVFLGVLLALVKPDQVNDLATSVGEYGVWVLTGVILLLILCVVLCLACMWTGKMSSPLSLSHLTDMLKNNKSDEVATEAYFGEKIAIWTACVEAQVKVSKKKHLLLFLAQLVLLIAIVLIAYMLVYLVQCTHALIPAK